MKLYLSIVDTIEGLISLVINNLTNAEYTIRPMAIEAPRLASIMYTYEIK